LRQIAGQLTATDRMAAPERPSDRHLDRTMKDGPLHSNGKPFVEPGGTKRPAKSSKRPPSNGRSDVAPADVRRLLDALEAAGRGDFTMRLSEKSDRGAMAALAAAFNRVASLNEAMVSEVVRVGRIVGREGRMTERAALAHAGGGWTRVLDAINSLIGDLVQPTTEVARVISAVADGDFTQKIALQIDGQPVKGEFLRIGTAVNSMVDQLSSFAAEVTRVAKEVGTDGKLGGQAAVPDAAGIWRDLTDNVNQLANNLTAQVRNIAEVTTAVARGDLSKKITVDAKGEVLELKNTVNTMVDQLNSFGAEVTRVAKEVGTDGKLGGQAEVRGVSGIWKILTDNVNLLANNLTAQVRNVAEVTTAVARGDLSKKITVDAKGEVLELKNTVNTMVDQLNSFAAEVTRVAKEVGTDGKLGGQATVPGVSGTWKDLTDNVNFMASNLTSQVRNIALVTTAVANGDLSKKITVDAKGEVLELKNTVNTMVDQLNSFAAEVTRVAKEVGTEGKLGGQADVRGVAGTWKDLTDNVNFMARNLTTQVRGIVKIVTAVANGDLKQRFVVEAKGEVAALAETINSMTDTLSTFAEQVSTVAREVGVEGKLGGQARVPGVAGTWKDLTDNVNFMARNLTTQVRGIVKVVTAVANGDLRQKLIVDAKGEVAALAETINSMTDTLGTFAEQVSTVAREVGIEGKLGGQAKVPGAMGTWRQLTDNVNQLAGNLTSQVRAISDVATAVTKGDLTRSITVQAQGEVASLKDNINQMIVNLKETTQKNTEQDWLKTNLAKFSGMMQGQKNLEAVSSLIMSQLTPLVSAHCGAFFMIEPESQTLKLTASYAYRERKSVSSSFRLGEGLVGQCALEKQVILLTQVPPDYVQISSGLGEAAPLSIIVLPVLFEGEVKAVIELASFHTFSAIHRLFLNQLMESIGVVLNMIIANMRTEQLLLQSQGLTQELQSQSRELTVQQDELKRTNSALEKQALELEEKARLLEEQNTKVEVKNREVEQARASLEEKATQLSLISKYKSEFLANMSHELRTPLNSLLILAKLLSENKDTNLSDKQVEYAKTIYAAGGDLLTLINEILDLSKVEAGKMQVEPRTVAFSELIEFVERQFGPVAEQKGLEFAVSVDESAASAIVTDQQRLQQVLKNLLANAFKFTDTGSVKLLIHAARPGTVFSEPALTQTSEVIGFSVMDSGIGIPRDKQRLIFEAFQQADGTTSRKYGGTGLGLSISREIARLLGGEIRVDSKPGVGSTFTLYLPATYQNKAEPGIDGLLSSDVAEALRAPTPVPPAPRDQEVSTEPDPILLHPVEDDRERLREGDRVLLIIEDDIKFARIMVNLARERGFKAVVATRGDTGLSLANELQPAAITLDLQLPVLDGWSVLGRLKKNPRTRHIPVHVISVVEKEDRSAVLGAFAYLEKPVTKESLDAAFAHISTFIERSVRRLLLVESDEGQAKEITELVGTGDDVDVTVVASAKAALAELGKGEFDCMVVDVSRPGREGLGLIEKVKRMPSYRTLPVVVYNGKDLAPAEEHVARKYAESVIMKSTDGSREQLLNDTALFLHRVEDTLPEQARELLRERRGREDSIADRTVLVIDDDIRNIFALTSVLESHAVHVLYAENGRTGIESLTKHPEVDVVLLDIMMPELDGYETLRRIRKDPRYRALPIIAITAKALKEDREKCFHAGAFDYLPKPIEPDKLVDLVRFWTRRSPQAQLSLEVGT
jgi:signal transduction histidine kinase/HAMP domain-containing protein/DNA-binding response OmpR family regulator